MIFQKKIMFHGVPSLNPKGISAIATNLKQVPNMFRPKGIEKSYVCIEFIHTLRTLISPL